MKIKILKDEHLFSNEGTHICDGRGFAIKASEDQYCDVSEEHVDRVRQLLAVNRVMRGLDADGNEIIMEPLVAENIIEKE